MPPAEFSMRLQHGIAGGIVPPTPSAIHTITLAKLHPTLAIASATRDPASNSLQDAAPKSISASDEHTQALLDELHSILKSIPTESPPGIEDIYGMDTSIFWGSEDLEWYNGAPQGCGFGISDVQPTEEDKAKFKRAVEIVQAVVGKAQ
ncbi:hypothetical protein FISHEDRAFT_66303 [Fistulina hepatica ATCC 64428]|uniref:Uncharacterized protein n=1 Tax=Fistulina hepatica ATCC 64428 TaxID=1128425 RepID=A0A0D7A6W6_9AGAR|nr:hypothetical protein FISHEDRAFT_66303 [Fistulina hepatica ATCC 64428]